MNTSCTAPFRMCSLLFVVVFVFPGLRIPKRRLNWKYNSAVLLLFNAPSYIQEQAVIGFKYRNKAIFAQHLMNTGERSNHVDFRLLCWLLSMQKNVSTVAKLLPVIAWSCTDYDDRTIANARGDSVLLREWCWLIFYLLDSNSGVAPNKIQAGTKSPRWLT